MQEKDIEIFLSAKKKESLKRRIYIAVIGVVLLYVVVLFLGIHLPYSGYIVSGMVVGALSFDVGGWAKPTTTELLEVIERQIYSDPKAIRFLADKNA